MLIAALIGAAAFGLVNALPVYVPEMTESFHTSSAGAALVPAVALGMELGGAGVAGWLTARKGPRMTVAIGGILLVGGHVAGLASGRLSHAVVTLGALAGLGAACLYVPALTLAAASPRRGASLGLLSFSTAASGVLMTLMSQPLIDSFGWRRALLACVTLEAAALLTAVCRMPTTASAAPQRQRPPSNRAFAEPAFRWLFAAAVVGSGAFVVPTVLFVVVARSNGVGPASAAIALAVMNGANAIGRLLVGALSDRLGASRVLVAGTVVMCGATFLLAQGPRGSILLAAAALFGAGAGCFATLPAALLADTCPELDFAPAMGLLLSGYAVGAFACPPLAALLAEGLGSFTLPMLLTSALGMVSASLMLLASRVGDPPRRHEVVGVTPNRGLM